MAAKASVTGEEAAALLLDAGAMFKAASSLERQIMGKLAPLDEKAWEFLVSLSLSADSDVMSVLGPFSVDIALL